MTARSSASVALCLVAVLASVRAAAARPKATETVLREPVALAVDAVGNLYVADQREHRIWRVAPDGSIAAFAGTGERADSAATAGRRSRPGPHAGWSAGDAGDHQGADPLP